MSFSDGVSFEDAGQYKQALGTIRENYFPRTARGGAVVIDEESEVSEDGFIDAASANPAMSAYVKVIGKSRLEKQ